MDAVSGPLQRFIDESPITRGGAHLAFVKQVGTSLAPGARLLDIGSGDAPYREFFTHLEYTTCDRPGSQYAEADIVARADDIPVPDHSYDAILMTEVLEHLPDPRAALAESFRILRPGGTIWLTTPFVWYLHEQPYDYYRYTNHGLRFLLESQGFADIEVSPLTDAFSTLAQIVSDLGWMMGQPADGYEQDRALIARTMQQVADLIRMYSSYDSQWILPLGYSSTGVKPD